LNAPGFNPRSSKTKPGFEVCISIKCNLVPLRFGRASKEAAAPAGANPFAAAAASDVDDMATMIAGRDEITIWRALSHSPFAFVHAASQIVSCCLRSISLHDDDGWTSDATRHPSHTAILEPPSQVGFCIHDTQHDDYDEQTRVLMCGGVFYYKIILLIASLFSPPRLLLAPLRLLSNR
jgi:hypothetical protein